MFAPVAMTGRGVVHLVDPAVRAGLVEWLGEALGHAPAGRARNRLL